MDHYRFAVAEDGTRYRLELRDAVEPDQPIDDSINGKLDRILALLGKFITVVPDAGASSDPDGVKPTKFLHVHGSGPVTATTVPEPDSDDAVHDQQFGFDEKNLNPEVVAYVKKHQLNKGVSK